MSARPPWKIWTTLVGAWVLIVFLGATVASVNEGLDSILPSFLAVLWLSACLVIPVVGGIATGQWAARASGRLWIGWAAGLATVMVLGLFFLQLQDALPRSMRYWIRRLG